MKYHNLFFSFSFCIKPLGERRGIWIIAKPVLVTGKMDGGFPPVHGTFPALPKRHGASERSVRNALDGIIIAHGTFIEVSALTCNPAVFRLAKSPPLFRSRFSSRAPRRADRTFLAVDYDELVLHDERSPESDIALPGYGGAGDVSTRNCWIKERGPICGQRRKLRKKCFRKL